MHFITLLAGVAVGMVARTWRLDVVGNKRIEQLRESGKPIVFAVWHAHLLPPLWHRRGEGITLLVSGHADGGHLARAAQRWGYEVVRGSTTRGGTAGLRRIVRVLAGGGDVAFTPDGPRGPSRTAKPGTVAAAQLGAATIIPVGAAASSAWRFSSWDRFTVPHPFARVRIVYGQPIGHGEFTERKSSLVTSLEAALETAQREAECT
jgi:lysophospholipid acyltransferase (LPLAT)-like uncharacterized protein